MYGQVFAREIQRPSLDIEHTHTSICHGRSQTFLGQGMQIATTNSGLASKTKPNPRTLFTIIKFKGWETYFFHSVMFSPILIEFIRI